MVLQGWLACFERINSLVHRSLNTTRGGGGGGTGDGGCSITFSRHVYDVRHDGDCVGSGYDTYLPLEVMLSASNVRQKGLDVLYLLFLTYSHFKLVRQRNPAQPKGARGNTQAFQKIEIPLWILIKRRIAYFTASS